MQALQNNTVEAITLYNKQQKNFLESQAGDNMTTSKTSMISLNTFDDKRLYVNNIKS